MLTGRHNACLPSPIWCCSQGLRMMCPLQQLPQHSMQAHMHLVGHHDDACQDGAVIVWQPRGLVCPCQVEDLAVASDLIATTQSAFEACPACLYVLCMMRQYLRLLPCLPFPPLILLKIPCRIPGTWRCIPAFRTSIVSLCGMPSLSCECSIVHMHVGSRHTASSQALRQWRVPRYLIGWSCSEQRPWLQGRSRLGMPMLCLLGAHGSMRPGFWCGSARPCSTGSWLTPLS